MAARNLHPRPSMGRKRSREEAHNEDLRVGGPDRKYARPTISATSNSESSWQNLPIGTPHAAVAKEFPQHMYDSDDHSSMVSEPGSPRDVSMCSDDGTDDDYDDMEVSYGQATQEMGHTASDLQSSPWRGRTSSRAPGSTPFRGPDANRTVMRPSMSVRTGVKQHIRQRHPQEISQNSDQLEVPSPVDEDEITTPPSVTAAEAAGSRLSMLSMSEMDLSPPSPLPTITVDPSTTPVDEMDSPMESEVVIRKQRQRSGAQSHGSVTPIKGCNLVDHGTETRRGFSIGFKADCTKCQTRVPGHMNHFIV